ncbi:hypothetical protein CKO29_14555 [Allochromatium vinosum]|nr:hypothetical protein [Allochromatium vinosum]
MRQLYKLSRRAGLAELQMRRRDQERHLSPIRMMFQTLGIQRCQPLPVTKLPLISHAVQQCSVVR